MVNLREQFSEWRLRHELQKEFKPHPHELDSSRKVFLNSVRQLAPATSSSFVRQAHHHVIRWRYALIAALVGLSLTGGMMTYADVTDVPVTHPLYNFKRLDERLRLSFSTPEQRIQLHREFAERRLRELGEMEPMHQQNNQQLQSLSNDAQTEADDTVNQAEQVHLSSDQRHALCNTIMTVLDHKLDNNRIDHIRAHCHRLESEQD